MDGSSRNAPAPDEAVALVRSLGRLWTSTAASSSPWWYRKSVGLLFAPYGTLTAVLLDRLPLLIAVNAVLVAAVLGLERLAARTAGVHRPHAPRLPHPSLGRAIAFAAVVLVFLVLLSPEFFTELRWVVSACTFGLSLLILVSDRVVRPNLPPPPAWAGAGDGDAPAVVPPRRLALAAVLAGAERVTVGAAAARIGVPAQELRETVGDLAAEGLVRRGPGSGRREWLALTDTGSGVFQDRLAELRRIAAG
ncbi:MarR family transcriptional regulator [Nocardiopsis composta]|uniref:Uncharacterized protein n=1 Tax=Nocardiopsis composta TaxID=157465 RepID=A0A7W8QMZ6_9ACTN|nr:MarR family transcriptional regulator [Nocardiopsis composta]MBB5433417.1 hypothetical protein [Nocardiopsis composta]